MGEMRATIVLDCGHTFDVYGPDHRWEIGHWASCPIHSRVVGYDPDTGDPKYDRDRRVVEVRNQVATGA